MDRGRYGALPALLWLKGFGNDVPTDPAYRAELKARVAAHGPAVLHAELARLDPERAGELHPNDVRRVGRALEIIRATGRPASEQRHDWGGPDRVAARLFGLRRDWDDLDDRIGRRTEAMFEAGLVDEVREILTQDLSPQASKTLGLEEVRQLLEGELTEAEAKERITQRTRRTRRFARKQMTFFRSFEHLTWLDLAPDADPLQVAQQIASAL